MVLVSYPKGVIDGIICRGGVLWEVPEGNKKAGCYPLARRVLLSLGATVCSIGTAKAGFRHYLLGNLLTGLFYLRKHLEVD